MAILDYAVRPLVVFDASNKEHRAHYANFLKTNTWGNCPVRFEVRNSDASNNNLAFAMQRMLTEYYISKEFKPLG
jgi:hypothetical protein